MPKSKKDLLKIIEILEKKYPNPTTDLTHYSAFELLIATMLSAQCTDKRVNLVTPQLFSQYKTPESLAEATQESVEKIIHSTGFYKNKAKNIIACAKILAEKFDGKVPGDIAELVKLPGVGRKTANCVLGNYFTPAGVVVDTHVIRICNLLGIVSTKNPEKIEQTLMELLPQKYWVNFTHFLIKLGREICVARRPKCEICEIAKFCSFAANISRISKVSVTN